MTSLERRVITVACCIGCLIGAIAARGDGVALSLLMAAIGALFAAPVGAACVLVLRLLHRVTPAASEERRSDSTVNVEDWRLPPAQSSDVSPIHRDWHPANPDRLHAPFDLPPVHREQ
jgi:hypothetical protein